MRSNRRPLFLDWNPSERFVQATTSQRPGIRNLQHELEDSEDAQRVVSTRTMALSHWNPRRTARRDDSKPWLFLPLQHELEREAFTRSVKASLGFGVPHPRA